MNFPSISFVIGVLNERERLPRVLESIARQDAYGGAVEVIVADGGSTDGTAEFARAQGCRVIDNPLGRCEPGIALGVSAAIGDVIVVMAADNPLFDAQFLQQIAKPFGDPSVAAAFPLVVSTDEDTATVRYLNCFTDPFNHFVYWNAASPLTFGYAYRKVIENDDYVVYDFTSGDPPLIAMAQGFAFRRGMRRPEGTEEDDVAPVEALIRSGGRVAFVPNARIEHHTVADYRDFIKKFEPRIAARLRNRNMAVWTRNDRHSQGRRLRRTLWPFYAISFVAPAAVAVFGLARDRRAEWLLHPFLSFGLALAFWRQALAIVFSSSKEAGVGRAH